jgi:hypothetical protein
VGEAIVTAIHERCGNQVITKRVTAMDTYVPLGPAADHVLPGERDIEQAALELLNSSVASTRFGDPGAEGDKPKPVAAGGANQNSLKKSVH